MKKRSWLSCLLALAMLLSCFAAVMLPASAEGATYDSDDAAVEAGYYFRLNDKYYKNLVDAHLDVVDGDTIYMLADYTNNSAHEYVGWDAAKRAYTDTKTYTIIGGGHTYSSSVTHGLHFYSANVTIDGMNYAVATGNVSGMRIERSAKVTLKNCTFEKLGVSDKTWNTPVIVYGALTLDEGAVLKNNGEGANANSHGAYLEGKDENEQLKAGEIIPKLVLKANSTIDAKQYAIYESTQSELEVLSHTVKLIDSSSAEHTGSWRKAKSDTTVTIAGPTDEDYGNPEVKAAWKDLYTKLGETWIDTPNVDKDTILSYKPDMGAASVRMKDDSYGLRFTTTISADVANFAKAMVDRGTMTSFSYGTLIVRYEDIKDMTDITLEALTAANVKYLDVKAEKGIVENSSGSVTLSTALVNIKEANYGVKFCAISYITYVYADTTLGTITTYAAPSEASSIADAAWRALADVSTELKSGCTNPLHSYWKLENGEYVEVDGDVYTKYSKAQQAALLAFTSAN
ncbi:MAG TPA: hypothetical protein DDW30_06760 [Clostridiales bacterium]|nr:hypothetical protein [Clostridiales bacterium]